MGAFVGLPLSAFISEFEADISDGAASLGGPELPKFDFNRTVSFRAHYNIRKLGTITLIYEIGSFRCIVNLVKE